MDIGHISCWDDCLGNGQIKEHLRNLVAAIRIRDEKIVKQKSLLVGDTRSGKTSILEWFLACLHCQNLCSTTLNPNCGGNCKGCTGVDRRHGEHGLYTHFRGDDIHSHVLDCTLAESAQEIRNFAHEFRGYDGRHFIILDEVWRLANRGWDELLLTTIDKPGILWFGTAMDVKKLDRAFQSRFNMFPTEPSGLEETCLWITRRMRRHRLCSADGNVVVDLAKEARQRPGMIIEVLRMVATKSDRTLRQDDLRHLASLS